MSTWPGEGFQQEAAEAYMQSNKKRAEKQVHHYLLTNWTLLFRFGAQMVRIDENQEAIAFIWMAIDNNTEVQVQSDTEDWAVLDFRLS